ncbi:MAG: hypothetical protein Q4A70_02005 [Candidatus Saccharibacteria bacterium]|nr:hypothetical protein [Candidatus Saccharibacteria bacterium]
MALATADIHVKIDPLIKKKAEGKFRKAGITMSEFINLELRRVVRDERMIDRVIDEALPENLRINSESELEVFLDRRIKRQKFTSDYYTVEQAKDKIMRGEMEMVK